MTMSIDSNHRKRVAAPAADPAKVNLLGGPARAQRDLRFQSSRALREKQKHCTTLRTIIPTHTPTFTTQ